MDQILIDLKSPAWWFSAFVFATVVNVMGGFLKDRVGAFFSRYSERARERRAEYLSKRAAAIESLAKDGTYLNIAHGHAMAGFIVSMIVIVMFLLYLQDAQTRAAVCELTPALKSCSATNRVSTSIFIVVLGGLTMWMHYKVASRIRVVREGVKAYRVKHGLARLV